MSRLIETIRIEDGHPVNLPYHQLRFDTSRKELFGSTSRFDLGKLIRVPEESVKGRLRCRIIYDTWIRKIEYLPYQPRTVTSLMLVRDDLIDYRYKYQDRSELEQLLARREACDDILIVQHGLITDTSYSNIVFLDHTGRWITPDPPLLPGTMRQFLIETGQVSAQAIPVSMLPSLKKARLINSMNRIDEGPEIQMENIIPT